MRIASFVVLGCLAGCVGPVEDEEEVGAQRDALVFASAQYAGSTELLVAGYNNASWVVNQPDWAGADNTRLTATIIHGGGLSVANTGLDHIVVAVRGVSVDGAFQQMGLPLQTGTFLFGETMANAGLPPATLKAATSGRGITFWAVGNDECDDQTRPCARFENYTYNHHGSGLIPNSVPLNVSTAPFQVTLESNGFNMSFTVKQGGVVKSSASCRTLCNNSSLCGMQPDDAAAADAFVAFLNEDAMAGRTVGGTNITVTHMTKDDAPPCPGCNPL